MDLLRIRLARRLPVRAAILWLSILLLVTSSVAEARAKEVPTTPTSNAGARASSGKAASPAQGAESSANSSANDVPGLRSLVIPVENVGPGDIRDTYSEGRPGHMHEAIDIAAPKGTKVFAVDDGKVVKLFTSVPGGLTIYQFDPQARLAYYYAHLDRYAAGIKEGISVRRCDLLGYVGATGNASSAAPHLHFAMFRLGAQRQWWKGTPINPYAALVGGGQKSTECPRFIKR